MGTSFADHLAALDDDALVGLLRRRPDPCLEPTPSDVARLADRWCSPASLGPAIPRIGRDALEVGRAVAVGRNATVATVGEMLEAPRELVERAVGELVHLGLAWLDGPRIRLPDRLWAHWRADVGGGPPIRSLSGQVVVEDLRAIAGAQGLAVTGLRKQQLVDALASAWTDRAAMARRIAGLPEKTRRRLHARSTGSLHDAPVGSAVDDHRLVEAGLVIRRGSSVIVPHEVALGSWLSRTRLGGVPELPVADGPPPSGVAAAQEALRLITTVLDDTATTPLTALKTGGVGKRERARLTKRLALTDDATACLLLDVAIAAGLLGVGRDGYTATEAYAAWRADEPGPRWAALATAWFALDVAASSRLDAEGKEVPPPMPMPSTAGFLRRALLAAASPDASVAAAASIDWFCPLHGCTPGRLAELVAAGRWEAAVLGVVEGDHVSELGRALVDAIEGVDVTEVASGLLVEPPCEVILQSDLTAVVAGRPDPAATRLFADAAEPETRGTATTHRFSPASVRRAFDAGWDADRLLAALRRLSERPLPQPLEYLVGDVARRHGEVRVRSARTVVVAEEALVEELLHARALRALTWSRLAPTVLCSPEEPDEVFGKLCAAGHFPVREDSSGALVVARSTVPRARGRGRAAREAVRPEVLVARLRNVPAPADSATVHALAELNPRLDAAELELLADAVDRQRDVHLTYRDQNGTVTHRTVTPERVLHRWLVGWCHLRRAEREFTVGSIQNVAPPVG